MGDALSLVQYRERVAELFNPYLVSDEQVRGVVLAVLREWRGEEDTAARGRIVRSYGSLGRYSIRNTLTPAESQAVRTAAFEQHGTLAQAARLAGIRDGVLNNLLQARDGMTPHRASALLHVLHGDRVRFLGVYEAGEPVEQHWWNLLRLYALDTEAAYISGSKTVQGQLYQGIQDLVRETTAATSERWHRP